MIDRFQDWLPRIVIAPSFLLVLLFVYGFILYTGFLSMTNSKMLPSNEWVGFANYTKLFKLRHWDIAITNLAIFGILYIVICSCLGLFLAILLDQKIRAEGLIRPIYLYPMALSFIVTGTAWKWFLDPGIGIEHTMHLWGWESFQFNWIKDRNYAIYTVVMAHLAIKAYDLVIALTGGGPGDGIAGNIHVFLHLHPQPNGHRGFLGDHHAGDDFLDHHSLRL